MEETTKQAMLDIVFKQCQEAYAEGIARYHTAKRRLTFKQEVAFRLCHQNFCGLSVAEAAEVMGITRRAIEILLNTAKETAPQLFPILPVKTAKVYEMFLGGQTVGEIAEELGVSSRRVKFVLTYLHDHRTKTGVYFRTDAARRIKCYLPQYDEYVKEKF